MTAYSLRPVQPDDYEFLYDLHCQTMRGYVEPLWGWDEAQQRLAFQERFKLAGHYIILVAGQAVGRIAYEQHPDRFYISQINILPDYQGQGIGSTVIQAIIAEAGDKPVELRVLSTNQPAQRLYERLNFQITHVTDTHTYMRHP